MFYVGKNRVEAAKLAIEAGADTLLLDDGMQYRSLHRDHDIVVIDARDPFGRDHFLPRGFLREHPRALSRASLIIVNHASSENIFQKLKEKVGVWSDAPVVGVTPQYIETLSLDEKTKLDIKEKKVLAFCGIAKPKYFFELLEKQGVEVVSREVLPDHEKASKSFLIKAMQKAKALKADCILCTEKDAVKINSNEPFSQTIGYVKIKLVVTYGKEVFEKAISKMV